MTAMKARMKAAMAVAPPKAMQAKKAKKEEQWMKKKNAELQQAKRDNVRLSVEFASIQAWRLSGQTIKTLSFNASRGTTSA